MPIRAIIVDDEELARDEMKFLLSDESEVEIVGEAAGGEEAVALVAEANPDLIFLDIQMPAMDGFEVVTALLEKGHVPLIVFTTAYDKYAIRAFEINAVDYLLKPIDKDRLEKALERAMDELPRSEEYVKRIRKLTDNIRIGTPFPPRIVLKKGDGVELIEVYKVAAFERKEGAVTAHTDEGDHQTNYGAIEEVEVQLDPSVFVGLGNDCIVNIKKISEIVPWTGGNYIIVLDDAESTEIRLSRSQSALLKNKVEGIF